ncbi:glycosyltransferase [Paramagnetospirillum kuznetsovii]|uniref:Glycosyltransferase n=1 Tax=Paramagnetospirillum kuznetsovii TaxID=2053833 RepID=A0A364P2H8_9PROT|nr:glycosyltransferase family 2 protein [Paramagnetospirillum kuznetsovii]RAU23559.1 glycosyltransferase [Paramagnetospirillum kuznetsovii]
MADKTLISLVIPAYNEADNIRLMYETLVPILDSLADRYDFEMVFTDNHSTDDTFFLLQALAQRDPRIRVLRFSRNFGYQRSILTGYQWARGAAAIQLDCDLQDPPTLIPEFIGKWEEGFKVVYGVRITRQEGAAISLTRKIFYRIIRTLSEVDLPLDAGDFRLIDRSILDILKNCRHANPYLRGTIAKAGFKTTGIHYDRLARAGGESKFSLADYFAIAVDGIVSQSVVPLRLATYVGLAVAVITMFASIAYVIAQFIHSDTWPRGFATLAILMLFSITLNAIQLGILGEYVARIYRNSQDDPLTIIEQAVPTEFAESGPEWRKTSLPGQSTDSK